MSCLSQSAYQFCYLLFELRLGASFQDNMLALPNEKSNFVLVFNFFWFFNCCIVTVYSKYYLKGRFVTRKNLQLPLSLYLMSIAEKCFDMFWGILKMASVKSVEPGNNCFSVNHIIRCRSKLLP